MRLPCCFLLSRPVPCVSPTSKEGRGERLFAAAFIAPCGLAALAAAESPVAPVAPASGVAAVSLAAETVSAAMRSAISEDGIALLAAEALAATEGTEAMTGAAVGAAGGDGPGRCFGPISSATSSHRRFGLMPIMIRSGPMEHGPPSTMATIMGRLLLRDRLSLFGPAALARGPLSPRRCRITGIPAPMTYMAATQTAILMAAGAVAIPPPSRPTSGSSKRRQHKAAPGWRPT
jgi:hypothetical protein